LMDGSPHQQLGSLPAAAGSPPVSVAMQNLPCVHGSVAGGQGEGELESEG
jgi:hypothetical protein